MADLTICQVCRKVSKKYKCPSCSIFSCSLDCFKDHKLSNICKERREAFVIDKEPSKAANLKGEDALRLLLDEVKPEHAIPQESLEQLGHSEELKRLLTNKHLRDYLTLLNDKNYPKGLLRNAIKEPLFVEFADACLKLVQPEGCRELTDEEVVKKICEDIEDRC